MIQIRNVFPEETWLEFFSNHLICTFWQLVSTQQYNLFFTRRELHRTCCQMQKVVENTDIVSSATYLELERLELRYVVIVEYIKQQIEEIARIERVKSHQRGLKTSYTGSMMFKKLIIADQQLVNEARLLLERIESLKDHAEKIEALKREMFVHFERCSKQYNSVQLSMHISDIQKTVQELKLEALKPLSDQLRRDVDGIKDKMNELGRKMMMHENVETRAFSRFNTTSTDNVSELMTDILSTSNFSLKEEATLV